MNVARIWTATKLLIAPFSYMSARFLGSTFLGRTTLELDPQYLRALQFCGFQNRSQAHVTQFQIAAMLSVEATPEAAELIKRLISVSESQILQDILCVLLTNGKKNGFFVEVGVGSGRSISNTYMLEKHYGWKGLLVEPNRSSHASIIACRKAVLERRAAASETGKKLRFEERINAGEYSRIVYNDDIRQGDEATREYEVETITLTDALESVSAPKEIDFLSLDTEGSEVDILRGLNLERYRFKVIVVEHNFDRMAQKSFEAMLAPLGYNLIFSHISSFDSWYVHKDVASTAFSGREKQ